MDRIAWQVAEAISIGVELAHVVGDVEVELFKYFTPTNELGVTDIQLA